MSSESAPAWSGELLNSSKAVEIYTKFLRDAINELAVQVAEMRRGAEAMWKANPPEGYNTYQAWWRHLWVTSPFADIQEHLEKAAERTFTLETRYRKGRHEIPDAKLAAARAKLAAAVAGGKSSPQLGSGNYGSSPVERRRSQAGGETAGRGSGFMNLVDGDRRAG